MLSLKLPKKAKPSKALSRDLKRPELMHAYVAQPNGQRELIATDSYIMARLPVAEDVPLGPITAEAVQRIEKGEQHEITKRGSVRFNGKNGAPVEYHSPEQTQPPFGDTPPSFNAADCTVVAIGLNPTLLKNLSDALGATHGVQIEIPVHKDGGQALRGMRVTPLGGLGGGGEGLLMPIRLNV